MFTDLYELLQISPNANSETIERIFRYFAKRYHPDNGETGDVDRFNELVEAHNTLKDPAKRAEYDVQYNMHSQLHRQTVEEASDSKGLDRDIVIQDKLLALLYVRRRRDVSHPGIGEAELEVLSGCPAEHLDFHLWYLKAKGWIAKTENGTYAITVEGVDRASAGHPAAAAVQQLLTRPGYSD